MISVLRRARMIELALLLPLVVACGGARSMPSGSPELATFIDRYLDGWAQRHPSIAAGNGLHQHDDKLEAFSQGAIDDEIRWLRAQRDSLRAIDTTVMTPDEYVDRTILLGVMDGWLLDLGTAKNWRRNPMIYASAVSDGIHNLMTMESSPAEVRMRSAIGKLDRVPELLQSATENLTDAPRILVQRGITMWRGAAEMLRTDLRTAFANAGTPALRDSLFTVAGATADRIDRHVQWLERELLPAATGKIALGADYVAARYKAEDMIDLPLDTLLAIGERELAREEEEFQAAARRIDSTRTAIEVWRTVRQDHPKRGELVGAAQRTVDDLTEFVQRSGIVQLPSDERVVVAPSRPYNIGLASMHASPPLEATPVKSYYYVTDANPTWPVAQQLQWLERFNYASLAITSAHEAMPGHFVHALYMRETPGKVRRIWIGLNPFPQPSSGQDGWAHYAEHLVVEQGFHADDPRYAMAQLTESMTRICRLIASIRVHTGEWSVDQAAKFFETAAHLPVPAARQEAERTAYDPTNGGYFLGKRAALKLRKDYRARVGESFTLRDFHARVMKNGIAPWWAHRYLMLPGDTGRVVE